MLPAWKSGWTFLSFNLCSRMEHSCLNGPAGNAVLMSFTFLHLSLNHGGRWGTTDDFTTSFPNFLLFSTALWDLANSRPVHSLMLSSHLFFCLPCLLFPFHCALQDGYGQTWWTGNMTIPLQFASLDLLRHLSWSFPEICWRGWMRVDIPLGLQLLFESSLLCCCWRGRH